VYKGRESLRFSRSLSRFPMPDDIMLGERWSSIRRRPMG